MDNASHNQTQAIGDHFKHRVIVFLQLLHRCSETQPFTTTNPAQQVIRKERLEVGDAQALKREQLVVKTHIRLWRESCLCLAQEIIVLFT